MTIDLATYLDKITWAPLKPQQRLHILRTYLIPRYLHQLVLGRVTYTTLRCADKQVRKQVRKCLYLPNDVPKSFFHTPIKEGGIGIMSFETKIPELTKQRLDSLSLSTKWCEIIISKNIEWPKIFHRSVDGYELRETCKCAASYSWVNDPCM